MTSFFNNLTGSVNTNMAIRIASKTWVKRLRKFFCWNFKFFCINFSQIILRSSMGRFVMMINDLTADMGCSLVKFFKDDLFNLFFICNYSSNNRLNQRVYETGTPTSSCNSGAHRIYTALCSAEEKINPNHHHIESITSFN